MSLRFILGPAGSGKTRRCLDEIVGRLRERPHDGEPLYFLVPEQATYQMERALLEHDEAVWAISRARVVSFKRLAHLALEREGPLDRPFIGELGRLLALHAAIKREQDQLLVYRRSAATAGFLEQVGRTIQELKAHRQDAGSLTRAREALVRSGGSHESPDPDQSDPERTRGGESDLLAAKLRDIERVYERFESLIRGRFQDGDEALAAAAQVVETTGFAAGARVWVDGFAGFTPQEYAFLEALLANAAGVTVALCVDPGELPARIAEWDEGPADGLFHPTRETLVAIRDLAAGRGVPVEPPLLLGAEPGSTLPRFGGAPLLGAIERALVESEGALYPVHRIPDDPAGERPACAVIEAPDRAGEVEAAAREIVRLVRESGCRYSEIGVVARSLDVYQPLVENTFLAWGIPYFLDQVGSAIHHPLVAFVEAALEMLSGGVDTAPLVRLLKTDLAPVERDEVDRLENLALALGARGGDWIEGAAWGELDGVRRRALDPLLDFLRRTRKAGGCAEPEDDSQSGSQDEERGSQGDRKSDPSGAAREPLYPASSLAKALYEFLLASGVPGKLEAWADRAEEAGRRNEARDHRHVWEGFCRLIDEIVGVIGDAPVALEEFVTICQAGLKRLRLGRVPAHVDEVLVGTVDRSRQPELRCVILLGWNEGSFPLDPAEDPIFSDADRERLRSAQVALGPSSRERLFHERYLIYIALTRASERMILTYSRSDESGRPLRASPVIGWLLSAFPEIRFEALPASASVGELPERPGAFRGWLARGLRAGLDGDSAYQRAAPLLEAARRWSEASTAGGGGRALAAAASQGLIDPMDALGYANRSERLPADVTASIYPVDPEWGLVVSPSALEDAAACPFKHFAGYGLRLVERERPKLDAALLGTLGHAVLREAAEAVMRRGKDWGDLSCDESDALISACFEKVRRRAEFRALRGSASAGYAARRLLRALQAVGRNLADASRAGAFRPAALEVSFGPGMKLPPVAVASGPYKGAVRGRIDRIDAADDERGRYVRVVDYKSSAKPMRLSEVFYGLDLALCIYLAAVESSEDGVAAGCLYAPVVDPVASIERPGDGGDAWRRQLRPKGLVVDDGTAPRLMDRAASGASLFAPLFFKQDGTLGSQSQAAPPEAVRLLLRHVVRTAGRLVEQILSGETAIAPYEHGDDRACTVCAYRPVCQFDPTAPPQGYRRLRPLRDEEVWERVLGAADEEGGEAYAG